MHYTSAWQHKHMSIRAFQHITKSSSAAGCAKRWLGNTSTRLVCPQPEDDFAKVYVCEFLKIFPNFLIAQYI